MGVHSVSLKKVDGVITSTNTTKHWDNSEVALPFNFVKHTHGTIPLIVDRKGLPLRNERLVANARKREGAFMNLTDGASAEFTPLFPVKLDRMYVATSASNSGYHTCTLDATIAYEDGTTDDVKLQMYNYLLYGQDIFKDKTVKGITVTYKDSSQVVGMSKPYLLNTANGKLLANDSGFVGGLPVRDLEYFYFYESGSVAPFYAQKNALKDITAKYSITTTTAAKAGTAVANVLNGDPAGFIVNAANAASFALVLKPIDPKDPPTPYLVEIEYFEAGVSGLYQVVVGGVTSAFNESASNSNTQRFKINPSYVNPNPTRIVPILVYPNSGLEAVGQLTITTYDNDAATKMGIKSIKLFGFE